MDESPTPLEALEAAIAVYGSQSEMARRRGVSQPAVNDWVRRMKQIPGEHVLPVEADTGVPCWQLRPDLYPPERFAQSSEDPPASSPPSASSPMTSSPGPSRDGGGGGEEDALEGVRT